MSRHSLLLALLLAPSLLLAKPLLVVTTTLIATAVQDVSGDTFQIEILMPAGTCPGQFDLDPRQAAVMPKVALILRHEMQGFLDRHFISAGAKPERIAAPMGSFTIPGAYLAYCEKIAAELIKADPQLKADIETRLQALKQRLESLSRELKRDAAPLSRTRVVVARFQYDLLQWLGLEPVAVIPPSEDPSPTVLRKAIQTGTTARAVLVVGNVQNGSRVPEAIASALGIPCLMLGNFPVAAGAGAQDGLMRHNLELLLTWQKLKER